MIIIILPHTRQHIEAKHIAGIGHPCTFCSRIIKTRDGLRTHVKKMHSETNE